MHQLRNNLINLDIKNRAKSPEIRYKNSRKYKLSSVTANLNNLNAENSILNSKKASIADQQRSQLSSIWYSADESTNCKTPNNLIIFQDANKWTSPFRKNRVSNYQKPISRDKRWTKTSNNLEQNFNDNKNKVVEKKRNPMLTMKLKNEIDRSLNFDRIQARTRAKIDTRVSHIIIL